MRTIRQNGGLLGRFAAVAPRAVLFAALAFALPSGVGAQSHPKYPSAGTTFVPLDSWVYPAFERLAGLGYVKTAIMGLKPWARTECARLTEEAQEALEVRILADKGVDELAAAMVDSLEREFRHELGVFGGKRNRSAAIESVYARVLSIEGTPLTDGYHFGQTVANDFGRPVRAGVNAVAGGAARAVAGPFAAYVRVETQHSPSAPALSDAVRAVIALRDVNRPPPAGPFDEIHRLRLQDAYVAVNVKNWQVAFGKQSISWVIGPSPSGSLLMSNNAEPLYMARVTRIIPIRRDGILGWMGPVKSEFFVSRLQGHRIFAGPLIYGQRISLKPGPNFEMAYGRTTVLGGGNRKVTAATFLKSMFGIKRFRPGSGPVLDGTNTFREGDSRTTFDVSWRIPGARDWLTFYTELYADDDEAGFMNPTKAVYKPGLHFARLPGLPKVDFTIEAVNSESPGRQQHQGSLNYWNFEFPDGHTNNGFLMGNTVGRQGRVLEMRANYWVSAQQKFQLNFKHSSVDADFIPGGGAWDDYAIRHDVRFEQGWYMRSALQVEHIRKYEVLSLGRTRNVMFSMEIGFFPQR